MFLFLFEEMHISSHIPIAIYTLLTKINFYFLLNSLVSSPRFLWLHHKISYILSLGKILLCLCPGPILETSLPKYEIIHPVPILTCA